LQDSDMLSMLPVGCLLAACNVLPIISLYSCLLANANALARMLCMLHPSPPLDRRPAPPRNPPRRHRTRPLQEEEAKLAGDVWCPVCKYPDYGRPLVQCDCCQGWYHYDCAGTHAEVGGCGDEGRGR
jgi:hypothetical protein